MLRMDEMTSTEFRRTYATLKEPTIVTVNGHPIGTWIPSAFIDAGGVKSAHDRLAAEAARFDVQPITPAPKPSAKR